MIEMFEDTSDVQFTGRKALCPTLKNAFRLKRDEAFDPNNAEHRQRFAHLIVHRRWPDGAAFKIEPPYMNIVSTVEAKLVQWALRAEIEELKACSSMRAA